MNFNHFGEFLKYIRTLHNLSQEQLAEGVCCVRQLIRIENGDNNPSLPVLHELSNKLNVDLQEYYRVVTCTGSFFAHKFKDEFDNLLVIQDYNGLKQLVEEMGALDEFQEGENLQYIFYGKAICSTYLNVDFSLSNNYCYEGLSLEDLTFNLDTIRDKIYSNIGLTMINLMGYNYNKLNEKDKSCKIFEDLFIVLHNYISNAPFTMYRSLDFQKKLYQSTTHNLGIIFMNKKEYNKALDYINKGIDLSLKENYMRYLPELLRQKSKLLFKIGNYHESYETYQICRSFYKLSKSAEDTLKLEKEFDNIISSYPQANFNVLEEIMSSD